MQHSHPLELRRILAAYELVQQMAAESQPALEPAGSPRALPRGEMALERQN